MTIAGWIENAVAAQEIKTLRQRALAAFAFGFAAALAFSPTRFFPILAVSFPALIILLRGAKTDRDAFVTGWSFAFGYFLLGLYWIAAAMFVDIGQFWWAVPLAVAGLPAICAIYYGLAAMAARRVGLHGVGGALSFALIWFVADYARGHLLTGFPWQLEGYAWLDVLPVMQMVSLAGIYGLTLLTLIVACLPAALTDRSQQSRYSVGGSLALLCVMTLWGYLHLQDTGTPSPIAHIRVVQPNVAQENKWDDAHRVANFQSLLNMTSAPAAEMPSLIIWPETASTYYLEEDTAARRMVAASLSEGSMVLTGLVRRFADATDKTHYANSLVVVDRSGRVVTSYDKFHLVPFGEYIPMRRLLPIRTLANLGIDFTAGQGLQTLHLDHFPSFSPLICYEAIFPGEVARRDDRPQMLINITNDGWYGKTAGPYQLFAMARTRAIEEGLPLVRSANTGISGVIDPYGRVVTSIALGQTGFIDADVPQPLPPNFYSRYRDLPVGVMFLGFVVLAGLLRFNPRKT